MDFATVYLKGTNYGGTTNEEGIYHLQAPAGEYTLVVSAIGYKTVGETRETDAWGTDEDECGNQPSSYGVG